MDILSRFGVHWTLLAAQIVNFLIVLFILKKFLYKPVLELLKKRQTTIKDGLEQAEEARIKLEKVIIEEKEILRQAQLQAKKIIQEAKNESIETTRQMNDAAKRQTEKMLKDAKDQIGRESIETEKRLAVNTSKLAVLFLEKALSEFFSDRDQKAAVSNALKRIRKID